MLYEHAFQNPEGTPRLLAEIERVAVRIGPVRLMEICGTHTMAIAKGGLRSLLPASVRLISGPGCPVCVTSAGDIDGILRLSSRHGLLLASYGDLLRSWRFPIRIKRLFSWEWDLKRRRRGQRRALWKRGRER